MFYWNENVREVTVTVLNMMIIPKTCGGNMKTETHFTHYFILKETIVFAEITFPTVPAEIAEYKVSRLGGNSIVLGTTTPLAGSLSATRLGSAYKLLTCNHKKDFQFKNF